MRTCFVVEGANLYKLPMGGSVCMQEYYVTKTAAVKGCWCTGCYDAFKGDSVEIDGQLIQKSALLKTNNDVKLEEPWVECDSCHSWVHQVCGLYNKGLASRETPYYCPHCLYEGTHTSATEASGSLCCGEDTDPCNPKHALKGICSMISSSLIL
jgi:hypothetical protein